MRNKLLLWLLIAALVSLTGWTANAALQARTPVRQAYEYKWISLVRPVKSGQDWTAWFEDDREMRGPIDIQAKLRDLGLQGWELVAVTPYSNNSGGCSSSSACDLAGFTSQITYYFKRAR